MPPWQNYWYVLFCLMWSFEVLSPPCGMVTHSFTSFKSFFLLSSEPTVWDGDYNTQSWIPIAIWFWAHRVGWRHSMFVVLIPSLHRSEPTVWDGDNIQDCLGHPINQFWAHRVGWRQYSRLFGTSDKSVLSPPCGMETRSFLGLSTAASGFWAHRVGWRLQL